VQINEKTYGPYEQIHHPTTSNLRFSKDISKFGVYYWVMHIDEEGYTDYDSSYVQINDVTYGPYDHLKAQGPTFTSDGSKFVFLYNTSYPQPEEWFIQINRKTYGPYELANYMITKDDRIIIAYLKEGYIHLMEVR